MKILRISGIFAAFLLALSMIPNASAAERDSTRFTFNQPLQIPGKILPAGSYWFVVPDPYYHPNVVTIYNANRTHVVAALDTQPALRATPQSLGEAPISHGQLTLAEQGPGTPNALLTWFYPGSLGGRTFIYSGRMQRQLNEDATVTIYPPNQHAGSLG